jgi:hypothetical protein
MNDFLWSVWNAFGMFLKYAGLSLLVVGGICTVLAQMFRQPGQHWIKAVPIWREREYYSPDGQAFLRAGRWLMLAGVAIVGCWNIFFGICSTIFFGVHE